MTATVNKFRALLFLVIREKTDMPDKLFAFNAGSFSLDDKVEGFLRSKGAIALDFGSSAYINSEALAAILSELVQRAEVTGSSAAGAKAMVATLQTELGRFNSERQKLLEDNARLASQAKSLASEIATLKEQATASAKTIEALRAENQRLALPKTPPQAPAPAFDDKMRLSYEKLAKEFRELRARNAEAITSLKVLEDENEELRDEVEALRAQVKNAPAAKAG